MNDDASRKTDRVIYFPGLDGTGRLLHRQFDLMNIYRVQCESYPQDRRQTYEELAETAAARFRQNHPGMRAILLAESFGGAVGMTFALRFPELADRIVFVNTFAYYPRRIRIKLASALGSILPRKPARRWTRPFRSFFFFNQEIPRGERDEWWVRTEDVPLRAFWYRLQLISRLDLRPRLGEISCPSLVLTAPNDLVVPPRAGRELAARLPQAKLLEQSVSHAAMVHPEINIARLLDDPKYWDAAGARETSAL